jgi:hypothetical protein
VSPAKQEMNYLEAAYDLALRSVVKIQNRCREENKINKDTNNKLDYR